MGYEGCSAERGDVPDGDPDVDSRMIAPAVNEKMSGCFENAARLGIFIQRKTMNRTSQRSSKVIVCQRLRNN